MEKILKTSEIQKTKKLKDFVGIHTDKEADKLGKIIEEECGKIDHDDWK